MSDHHYGYGAPYGSPYAGQQPGQAEGQAQNQANPQYGPQYAQQYIPYQQAYGYPYGPQYAPPYGQAPAQQAGGLSSWYNIGHPDYLKGLLLGAGAALVLTNPTVQKALIGGAVRVWAAVQGGVEEIKEQIEDVKAELSREG